MGKMVLIVLGMVVEMEVGFNRERQRAGIEAAKARGVYNGHPVTLDHARITTKRAERVGAGATSFPGGPKTMTIKLWIFAATKPVVAAALARHF